MMRQKNIDAVQYVKDLEAYLFEQETIKINEIKEKAKKKINEIRQKTENDRLFYRNILQIKQANPDLKISL